VTTRHRAPLVSTALFTLLSGACKTESSSPVADAALASTATATATARPLPTVAPALPTAEIQAFVNPAGLPPYAGPTGVLEGTVYVTGDEPLPIPGLDFSKCPDAKAVHGNVFREGPKVEGGKRPLLDAVVGVTGYKDAYIPAPRQPVVVEIKDCAFSARTVLVTFGQRLDIANRETTSEDHFYAINLTRGVKGALMVAPPGGEAVHLYPKVPGRDVLSDNMGRTFLTADVFVTRHPLNAVSGAGGKYRIEGIPVGTMRATAFHPAFPDANQKHVAADAGVEAYGEPVEIRDGKVTTYDVVLTYKRPATASLPTAATSTPSAPKLR
jgi:hypothetical protein